MSRAYISGSEEDIKSMRLAAKLRDMSFSRYVLELHRKDLKARRLDPGTQEVYSQYMSEASDILDNIQNLILRRGT